MLCSAAASLSGGLFSPEDRSQILSLLKSKLEEQVKGFDIEVADSGELGSEKDEYSRLYLTQGVEDLGCGRDAFGAYLGFSQNDPGNLDPRDIGITFIGSLSGKDKEELVRRLVGVALPLLGYGKKGGTSADLLLADEAPVGLGTIAGFANVLREIDQDVALDASKLYSKLRNSFIKP